MHAAEFVFSDSQPERTLYHTIADIRKCFHISTHTDCNAVLNGTINSSWHNLFDICKCGRTR